MRRSWFAAGLVAAAFVVAGCGDDDGSTGSAGGADTAASATEQTQGTSNVEAPPTTPPTEIPATQKLGSKPPEGKSITYLQCELPACAVTWPGVESAAEALGWKSKVQVYKSADPGGGLQQAIQEKPDYIAITGIPTAAIKAQLAAAHKAGIPVISCGDADKPSPEGYASQCGGTLEVDGDYLGRWVSRDSGGKANVVAVTIPQYTSLKTVIDGFQKGYEAGCPECAFSTLDVTVDDVGAGAVASKLVAHLQTNPDVDYALFTLADLATGVPAALKSAGLGDKVKLIAAIANEGSVKGITTGEFKAVTLSPNPYNGATMVDTAARLAAGDELSAEYLDAIYRSPTWVLDSNEEAEKLIRDTKSLWPGPEGYLDQYKSLWGLS